MPASEPGIPVESLTREMTGRRPEGHYYDNYPSYQDAKIPEGMDSLSFTSPLAAGGHAELTVEVLTARVGDTAMATPAADPGAGIVWSAWVSADDTVTVRIVNPTGSSATLTPQVWRVAVIKHP